MNILITGGLGYIGSYLIDYLLEHNLTIVDNLYTQRYNSLFNPITKFKFIEQNFIDIDDSILQNTDFIIHLAAIADATKSFKQQKEINQINTKQTRQFLQRCIDYNIKIIFPSSTSVYGESSDIVYEDDINVLNPQSPYAESKLETERFLQDKKSCVLRLGTVCGISKGIRFQTAINKFCYQAAFNQPLTVWKQNVNMKRPYLALQDLGLIINLMIKEWEWSQQTFNVLSDNLTPNNIIDKIRQHIKIQIKYTDCPLLNQYSYTVSNSKINTIYDTNPLHIDWNIKQTLVMLGVS